MPSKTAWGKSKAKDAIADAVRYSRSVSKARASFEKVSEELPSALDDSAELLKELRAVLPDFDDIPEGSIDEIKLLNKLINNPPKESGQYIVDRLRGNVDGGRVASLEARGKIRNVKKFLQARLRVDQVETAAEESARLRLGKKVTDSVEEKPLSVGQLREMASQARSKAAVYRQQGESNSERILNNMADSFLDTIESVENPDATDA